MIRKFLSLAVLATGIWAAAPLQAQCPGCVSDPACISANPEGGLCPEVIPAATVGQAYSENISFYVPVNAEDPSTGVEVTVLQVTITNISGLPFGLDWECNNSASGCVYTPPSSPPTSGLGCVKICGTPVGTPGNYTVRVDVIAQVVAFGLTLTQPLSFDASIQLLPPVSGATTFTFTGDPNCEDEYVATFAASVDGAPSPTTWAWNFGNGQTASGKNPAPVTYTPGSYTVSLTTTISTYKVTQVNLNSMNDNWCGDVEEPFLFGVCTANPDPYFIVADASGNQIYRSSTKDDLLSTSWTGLNIVVPPTFTITFWDEDLVSPDDILGTFSFSPTGTGTASYSGAGGTSGTINLGIEPQSVFNDATELFAFANPFIGPSADVTDATTVGGSNGAVDITFSGGTAPYSFFWSNGATTEDISGVPAGTYTVLITDANGCSTSADFEVGEPANVPCAPAPENLTSVIFGPTSALVSWDPLDQSVLGYQVQGRKLGDLGWASRNVSGPSLFLSGLLDPGTTYQWRVRAKCSVTGNISGFSATANFTTPTARELAETNPMAIDIYPNPVSDRAVIQLGVALDQEVRVLITDQLGRSVYENTQQRAAGLHTLEVDFSRMSTGMYLVSIQTKTGVETRKLIVE
jgi:hypothetical protein